MCRTVCLYRFGVVLGWLVVTGSCISFNSSPKEGRIEIILKICLFSTHDGLENIWKGLCMPTHCISVYTSCARGDRKCTAAQMISLVGVHYHAIVVCHKYVCFRLIRASTCSIHTSYFLIFLTSRPSKVDACTA